MTELDPLIKAFVKALEEAKTPDLTNTQFECFTPECQRIMMDSLDIEPGTVVCVGGWEAMRVVGNGDRSELVWLYVHPRGVRLMMSCVSSTMGLSDEEHGC